MRNTRGESSGDTLKGTNLHLERGVYYWRKVHEVTGKRIKKSCKTRSKRHALKKAAKFEKQYERELVGMAEFDGWRLELRPLAEEWTQSAKWKSKGKRKSYRFQILRALDLLRLKTLADLNNVASLNGRLLVLQRSEKNPEGIPAPTLEECVQYPLKLFAKWLAANQRYLPANPLATWAKHDIGEHVPEVSRALHPNEIARGFAAARCLDAGEGGQPLFPAFLALLITAPRSDRLCRLDAADLEAAKGNLAYGEPVGRKLPPSGALDLKTHKYLAAYRGERTTGPLFLSREGARLDPKRLLMAWRRAMSLAFTDELWPAAVPRAFDDLYRVSTVLVSGKPYRGPGGNPKRVHTETKQGVADEADRLQRIADELRSAWSARMAGVMVQSFRRTLETWARWKEIPEVLIDLHIGHRAPARDAALATARELIVSSTGRKHYFDGRLALLEPRRVAVAIREYLDEAEKALALEADKGRTSLVARIVARPALEARSAPETTAPESKRTRALEINRGDRIRTYDLCVPNGSGPSVQENSASLKPFLPLDLGEGIARADSLTSGQDRAPSWPAKWHALPNEETGGSAKQAGEDRIPKGSPDPTTVARALLALAVAAPDPKPLLEAARALLALVPSERSPLADEPATKSLGAVARVATHTEAKTSSGESYCREALEDAELVSRRFFAERRLLSDLARDRSEALDEVTQERSTLPSSPGGRA